MTFKFGKLDLVLDRAQLAALLTNDNGPVGRELLRIGVRIEGEAKLLLSNRLVRVITGRLRSSTTHVLATGRLGSLSVFVGSGADYAGHVHEGRPYLLIAAETVTGRSFT